MIYLLDTDTLSRWARGEEPVHSKLTSFSPDDLAVSSITVMEVEYGLALTPGKAKVLRPVLSQFLQVVAVLPFEEKEARATAAVRAALKKQGLPIGPYDVMIAGTALSHGLVLVTSNTREYERVSGLLVEDWRET